MIEFVVLTISLILLVKSADILVDNTSKLAMKLGVSKNVIGLTLVAFGTSFPELVVNILSSLRGENSITLGNIIGSNLANLSLVLGVSAIVSPITIHKRTVWREIPFATAIVLTSLFLIIDGDLSFWDGLVLYIFFILFLFYILEQIVLDYIFYSLWWDCIFLVNILYDSLIAVSQSLVATIKTDLAVGNIGSNIFNIGFILATSSICNTVHR